MKVIIKNGQGKQSDIDPKDLIIDGKPLHQIITEIDNIKKSLDKNLAEQRANAQELRILWQNTKK